MRNSLKESSGNINDSLDVNYYPIWVIHSRLLVFVENQIQNRECETKPNQTKPSQAKPSLTMILFSRTCKVRIIRSIRHRFANAFQWRISIAPERIVRRVPALHCFVMATSFFSWKSRLIYGFAHSKSSKMTYNKFNACLYYMPISSSSWEFTFLLKEAQAHGGKDLNIMLCNTKIPWSTKCDSRMVFLLKVVY